MDIEVKFNKSKKNPTSNVRARSIVVHRGIYKINFLGRFLKIYASRFLLKYNIARIENRSTLSIKFILQRKVDHGNITNVIFKLTIWYIGKICFQLGSIFIKIFFVKLIWNKYMIMEWTTLQISWSKLLLIWGIFRNVFSKDKIRTE